MRAAPAILCIALLLPAACGKARVAVSPDGPRDTMTLPHALIPAPVSFEPGSGEPFAVSRTTRIAVTDAAATSVGEYLAQLIASTPASAADVEVVQRDASLDNAIVLDLQPEASMATEGYRLSASASGVRIAAASTAGLFYGVQTLRQLLPVSVEYQAARRRRLQVPPVEIVDAPRFAWRGMMLDVARHFAGVDDVKRLIDLMALHKLNRLHLHLADDQGWRIEIESWPNLTRHGSTSEVGGGEGGFYTKADFAEIVSYASARFIQVVPEIDMPGHTNAALSSYPELNCDGQAPPLFTGIEVGFSSLCVEADATWRFVTDVVREIAAMSPAPYFHIGGDEVQKLTPDEYARFITRAEAIVRAAGKQTIGWDEVADVRLQPDSIVQVWRPGEPKGDVAQTGRLVLSPANRVYLDMKYTPDTAIGLAWAGPVGVRDSYDWDPAGLIAGVEESAILGVEGALWTETVANRADMEFLAFPRLAGIAEIGWTPQNLRDWDGYRLRLAAQSPRWTALGINFHRSLDVPWREVR